MPEARDGDLVMNKQCFDPDCPHHREGWKHAHLDRLERATGDVIEGPTRPGEIVDPCWHSLDRIENDEVAADEHERVCEGREPTP